MGWRPPGGAAVGRAGGGRSLGRGGSKRRAVGWPAPRLLTARSARPPPFGLGLSPTTPLSNSRRHSGPDRRRVAEELLVHGLREARVGRLEHVGIHEAHRLVTEVRVKGAGHARSPPTGIG